MNEGEIERSFKEQKKRKKKGKKTWEVYKASQKPWGEFNTINVDGEKLRFGRSGAMRLTDGKKAHDIKQALGGRPGEADVVVVEVDDYVPKHENPTKSWIINAPWKE